MKEKFFNHSRASSQPPIAIVPAQRGSSRIPANDDLAEGLAAFEMMQRGTDVGERKLPVHDRADPMMSGGSICRLVGTWKLSPKAGCRIRFIT